MFTIFCIRFCSYLLFLEMYADKYNRWTIGIRADGRDIITARYKNKLLRTN